MTKLNEVYKCEVCGNMTEMVHEGAGQMICCGQPMTLQEENTVDAAKEKHVPVVEEREGKLLVKVGEVDHPMDTGHYIEWIEIVAENGKTCRMHLKPGDQPQALFCKKPGQYTVRAYCNLHGLWKA